MIRRLAAVLLGPLTLLALAGPGAPAQATPATWTTWAHPATAAAFIACPKDFPYTLRYRYYSAAGPEVTNGGPYSVHVAVTVRDPDQCGSELIDQGQAATRGYDDGAASVGNVQVESVTMYAGNNDVRSGPTGVSNSNGGPSTGLIASLPVRCVSPFGTGQYYGRLRFTWRYNGALITQIPSSWLTPAKYNTC